MLFRTAQNHKVVSNCPSVRCSLPASREPGYSSHSPQRSSKAVSAVVNKDPTPYKEAVSDFEAAFEWLAKASGDKDEQRRAWLEGVNHTYRLREFRRKSCGKTTYEALAASHDYGKTTEGIMVVRNIATHILTVSANPKPGMPYPGPKTFPGMYLYPGDGNLFWLDMHELNPDAAQELSARDDNKYYEDYVAGILVLGTLEAVREFLINDVTNSFT